MHTSDLFHKQPWSDGLVNIYDQLGVDYYENKYRWVLGGDGGGDGGDSGVYDEPQAPEAYTAEGGQKGGYSTAEEAMSFFGTLTGARGTDQEYANLRAAEAAINAGSPTYVDASGVTRSLDEGVTVPGDYLSDAIRDFNENPSISASTLGALASLTGVGALPAAAIGLAGKMAGVPDLATVGIKDGVPTVDTPLGRALADQVTGSVTGKADGGLVVPQGGIGNFYGR